MFIKHVLISFYIADFYLEYSLSHTLVFPCWQNYIFLMSFNKFIIYMPCVFSLTTRKESQFHLEVKATN